MAKGAFPGHRVGGVCVGAVTAGRACQVVSGGWSQVDDEGARVDGIPLQDGVDGESVTFVIDGIEFGVSGAAVTRGQQVMADDDGKFIAYAAASGKVVAGLAHSSTTGADQSIEIQIRGGFA